jgi:exosortase/archaeosortase family protein
VHLFVNLPFGVLFNTFVFRFYPAKYFYFKKFMVFLSSFNQKWQQIPKAIRVLLLRGIFLLLIWKLAYTLWLAPQRTIDAPLTYAVANHTTAIMQWVWPEGHYSISENIRPHKGDTESMVSHLFILKNGKSTIAIADNCNGLELMVLYIAFIVCMPGTLKRKLVFIGLTPVLHLVNLARCMGLVGMHLQWPGMFDFAHHYLFKILVYATCFLMWVWYLKPITTKKQNPDV